MTHEEKEQIIDYIDDLSTSMGSDYSFAEGYQLALDALRGYIALVMKTTEDPKQN